MLDGWLKVSREIKIMEPEPTRRKRPAGLLVIAGLQFIMAVLLVLSLLGQEEIDPALRLLVRNPLFFNTTPGWLLVGMLLLAVLGLMLLRRWGWILTMVLTGLGLAFGIWSYFQGTPSYVPMLLQVVMVFYLNQHDVQQPFRRAGKPETTP
jgi:hypothetical protein